jgi:hypothetical protein
MRATATRLAVALTALIVAALVYLPIAPQVLENEPDLSFRATTHDAFARGLQSGLDIVSTYGPWGLLQRGWDPRTDAVNLTVSALLAALFAWGVLRVSIAAGGGAAVALAAMLTAASIVTVAGFDARFTVIALLLVLSALLPPSLARELPLVAALGPIALIKMSLLALALFVVVMTALLRRRPIHVVVFLAAFLAAWIAAGQRLGGLLRFLVRGMEVAGGYSGASASGSGVPLALIGAAGLAIVAVLVERSLPRIALVAGALAYLAKVGFVRADLTHGSVAEGLLMLLSIGYLLVRREAMPRARRAVVVAAMAAAAVMLVITLPSFLDRVRTQWSWMRDRPARLAAFQRDQARRSGAASLPAVSGTIDAYPWGSAALIARGLRYAPRPVFQSCMAWTPHLGELNAAVLRGPRAPEWLWSGVGSIDGRLPLLDDAPSWLEMMSRYDVAAATADHLLLHKRAVPRALVMVPAGTVAGNDAAVPDEPIVWCAIEARPSIAGVVRDLLGRPSLMTLETITAAGVRTRWRVAPAMLRGGFVISPQVIDVDALSRLLSGGAGDRVVRIHLTGNDLLVRFTAVRTPDRRAP